MDWKGIAAVVIGSLIIGWLGSVQSGLSEGKHERDIMGRDVAHNTGAIRNVEEGVAHVWTYNDGKDAKEKEEMKESFTFALDMITHQHETELKVKDLEIKILSK